MSDRQRRLFVLLGLLLVVQTGILVLAYFREIADGGRFGGDFISFWQAAQHVRAGETALVYNPDHWRSALGDAGNAKPLSWFVYPPFALPGLWPLGSMTYGPAVAWWSLLPLPVYFALAWLVAKRSGLFRTSAGASGRTSHAQAGFLMVAMTLPLLLANLFTGQTGVLIACCLLGAAASWERRPVLAGICIGLIAIKPQMGLLLPIALLAAGQWRSIWAAAVTIIGLCIAATLWLGPSIWLDYWQMTRLFADYVGASPDRIRQLAVGPYVSLRAIGAPPTLAMIVQGAVTVAVIATIASLFRNRDEKRLDLRFGMLAAGTLLATPYSLAYDTPLLVLALVPVLVRAWRSGFSGPDLLGLTGILVLPFVPDTLIDRGIPFGLLVVALLFGVLMRHYLAEERCTPPHALDETGPAFPPAPSVAPSLSKA